MPLVYIQWVGLPHAVGCCGPQCGEVEGEEVGLALQGVISIASGRLEDVRVVLRQPITTPYVHVNQTCSPRAFAKRFDDHSSSNIVAF
eukprot:168259-Pelagomonas_calceolata.AAC.1